MAREMTPRTWPSESRGMVDDATEALGAVKKPGSFFVRALSLFAPMGRVLVNLSQGQAAALDGSGMARVECLEGQAWVTCPGDGRDLGIRAGEAASIKGPGRVVVTAMYGPARIRLGWK